MSDAQSTFRADCYCVTSRGTAMPACYQGMGENGMVTVTSPNGQEYSFPADALLTVEEATEQLRAWRVDRVISSYQFEIIRIDRSGMVVRCWDPAHPVRSNYILTLSSQRETCSCPSYIKGAGEPCKHLIAAGKRELKAQPAARTMVTAHTSDTW